MGVPVLYAEKRMLLCDLTMEERVHATQEASAVLSEIAIEDAWQKGQKKAMASKMAELNNQFAELARKVETGREMREVEVEWQADFEHGQAIAIRLDTFEVVKTRPLDDGEKQVGLPLPEVPQAEADIEEPLAEDGSHLSESLDAEEPPVDSEAETQSHRNASGGRRRKARI